MASVADLSDDQLTQIASGKGGGGGVRGMSDEQLLKIAEPAPHDPKTWNNPPPKPSAFHTLKAFGRGVVNSLQDMTSGGIPEKYLKEIAKDNPDQKIDLSTSREAQASGMEKNLGLSDPGKPSTGDKIAEFAGGLLAPTPAPALRGGLGAARAADKAAGTTLGQRTGSDITKAIERTLARLPGGGSLVKSLREQGDKVADTTDDIVQRLSGGADTSSTGAGKVIESQAEQARKVMRGKAENLYAEVDKQVPPDHLVGVKGLQSTLGELTRPVQGAEQTSQKLTDPFIKSLAEAVQKDLKGSSIDAMPYGAVKELRTRVGNMVDWGPFSTDSKNGALKQLYGALTADMNNGAAMVSEDAAQAVKRANVHYTLLKNQDEFLSGILNKAGGPEKIFSSLMNGTKEGASDLIQVLSVVDEPSKKILAASALQRMGRATPGAQNATSTAFSVDSFLTNWNRVSPEARQALFGNLPGNYAQSINQVAANVEALKAYSKILPNTSNTAQVVLWGSDLTAAFMATLYGDFKTAGALVGSIGANKVLSTALTNPTTAAYLARETSKLAVLGAKGTTGFDNQ